MLTNQDMIQFSVLSRRRRFVGAPYTSLSLYIYILLENTEESKFPKTRSPRIGIYHFPPNWKEIER